MGTRIPRGTEPEGHAADLSVSYEQMLRGELPDLLPRPDVFASWRRSLDRGIDPDTHRIPIIKRADLLDRLDDHPLAGAVSRMRQLFTDSVNDPHLMMGIFDGDGVLIYRGGPDELLQIADTLNLVEGASWDEATTGTSAVSLVMDTGTPQLVVGAEHFKRSLHGLYCAAAPIRDNRTGDTIAIVGLAGPATTVQPAATALAAAVAAFGEYEVMTSHARTLDDLRATSAARLAGLPGPGLVVDDAGWVAAGRGFTVPDRVAIPVEGARQFVGGMGMCDVERLVGGWLLRPAGPSCPVIAELDLRGEPSLRVSGSEDPWNAVLTRRHAQILMLLADAGESGLTAARLSQLLFGDDGHVVTIRAEMSRLRRVVGILITSRPYRLARDVELRVVGTPDDSSDDLSDDEALSAATEFTNPVNDAGRALLDRPHVERPHVRA